MFLPTQRLAQIYQMYLPDHRFSVDTGLDDDVGPYVFASKANDVVVALVVPRVVWLSEVIGYGTCGGAGAAVMLTDTQGFESTERPLHVTTPDAGAASWLTRNGRRRGMWAP